MKKRAMKRQRGSALVVGLMVLAILTLLGTAAILITNNETKIAHNSRKSEQAFYAAEAGIARALCMADVEEGDKIQSNGLVDKGKALPPDKNDLKYEVEILGVPHLNWGAYVVKLESIGYDSTEQCRRLLRADLQYAPDASQGTVYEGTYRYEYEGSNLPEENGCTD